MLYDRELADRINNRFPGTWIGRTYHPAQPPAPDTTGIDPNILHGWTRRVMMLCGVDPNAIAPSGPIWNTYAHEAVEQLRSMGKSPHPDDDGDLHLEAALDRCEDEEDDPVFEINLVAEGDREADDLCEFLDHLMDGWISGK